MRNVLGCVLRDSPNGFLGVWRPAQGHPVTRYLSPRDRAEREIAAADAQDQTLSEWLREAGDLAVARGSTR